MKACSLVLQSGEVFEVLSSERQEFSSPLGRLSGNVSALNIFIRDQPQLPGGLILGLFTKTCPEKIQRLKTIKTTSRIESLFIFLIDIYPPFAEACCKCNVYVSLSPLQSWQKPLWPLSYAAL
jgi:hypothetical protein